MLESNLRISEPIAFGISVHSSAPSSSIMPADVDRETQMQEDSFQLPTVAPAAGSLTSTAVNFGGSRDGLTPASVSSPSPSARTPELPPVPRSSDTPIPKRVVAQPMQLIINFSPSSASATAATAAAAPSAPVPAPESNAYSHTDGGTGTENGTGSTDNNDAASK